jgi:hypothetical protein
MVSTGEKYALEIEFFALSRGFRAQISRSCAQKSIFRSQCAGSLENRLFQHNRPIAACSNGQLATQSWQWRQEEIGQKQPLAAGDVTPHLCSEALE